MKQYSNLDVIIDQHRKSEVRYNLESDTATVCAQTGADTERGIADLEARGVLHEGTDDPDDIDETRALYLICLDHSLETGLNDANKAEALTLARRYFGDGVREGSPAFIMMTGFLMGVNEGLRISAAINGDDEFLEYSK